MQTVETKVKYALMRPSGKYLNMANKEVEIQHALMVDDYEFAKQISGQPKCEVVKVTLTVERLDSPE